MMWLGHVGNLFARTIRSSPAVKLAEESVVTRPRRHLVPAPLTSHEQTQHGSRSSWAARCFNYGTNIAATPVEVGAADGAVSASV